MLNLKKPAYGEACNGCGRCCIGYPCRFGATMFKQSTGRCPALEETESRFECGLVAHPKRYAPFRAAVVGEEKLRRAALMLIGHGTGCDAQMVGEPVNEAYMRSREEKLTNSFNVKFLKALKLWGVLGAALSMGGET